LAVERYQFSTAGVPGRDAFELFATQGGAQLVHAVVVALRDHVVGAGVTFKAVPGEGGHAVRAQDAYLFGNFRVVGHQHAALGGGQVFVAEEAETAHVAPSAQGFAVQGCPDRVRGIFNHGQLVFACDLQNCRHIAGIAGIMHHHNRFGLFRDRGFHSAGREAQPVRALNIRENRHSAGITDRVRAGDEGERRQDHLVAGSDAERQAGQMQGGGGVGDCQSVGAARELGVLLLECLGDRTHRQPAGANDSADRFQFFRSKVHIREGHAPFHRLFRQKLGTHLFKVQAGLGVIIGVAQVAPVTVERKADHPFAVGQQYLDQVGEVQVLIFGDVLQHARLEDINAHAHAVIQGRLFHVPGNDVVAVVLFNHAQVDVHSALVHGNGADGVLLPVKIQQVIEIEQGEHIAVAHHESFFQIGHHRERSRGAQRHGLIGIGDVQIVLLAVLKKGLHQPGQVADGQNDMIDARAFHLAQKNLQDGFVANGHHWFGEYIGKWG